VPALVVTGSWSPLYDQTAEALATLGAERAEFPGAGHGAHKDSRANAVLREFWERVDAASLAVLQPGDAGSR